MRLPAKLEPAYSSPTGAILAMSMSTPRATMGGTFSVPSFFSPVIATKSFSLLQLDAAQDSSRGRILERGGIDAEECR